MYTLQQQVEKNYIDSLLGVGSQHPVETQSIEKNHADKDKALSTKYATGIANDSLYQQVLVDGLKFAIPLSEITMVIDHSNSITKGKLLFYQEKQLAIVSLNELISGKADADGDVIPREIENKQFLLIQHRQLAIECHEIEEIETIDKNIVCWRNDNSHRKWLAGTVKQLGVAILDLEALQQIMNNE